MEIRNIYEDYSGDERLYSVLMDEDEIALFSALEQRAYAGAWGLNTSETITNNTKPSVGFNRGVNREPGGVQRQGSFKGVQTPQPLSSAPTQTSATIASRFGESRKALRTSAQVPLRKSAPSIRGKFLTRMGR